MNNKSINFANEMANATTRISVITVCLNAAAMLDKTLLSVARQDYDNMEMIVVDGGSTDNTPQVLNRHKAIINAMVSEKDHGIFDAMNKGVGMATGQYCLFLNAGDTFATNDALKKTMDAVSIGPKPDVVYGAVVKQTHLGQSYVKPAEEPHNSHRMFFCHQSALTSTQCLREFPFDTRYTMSADLKLYKTLWKHGKSFKRVEWPIAEFDTTGVSNTNRAKGIRQNIEIIREIDGWRDQALLLPRLYFVLLMLRLRGKS